MQSEATAACVKHLNADNWSRTSEQYAQRAHKGSGMMMPLIGEYSKQVEVCPRAVRLAGWLAAMPSNQNLQRLNGCYPAHFKDLRQAAHCQCCSYRKSLLVHLRPIP
jgi:hypothetical protein